MEARQTLFAVLMLIYCTELALSLKCYHCSGTLDECNNATADTQTCLAGQDRCSSMMITKDGKKNANMGCANENDCKAGQKTCEDAKKKNVRTTCTSSCCTAEKCNTPPKQETNLRCYECQSGISMDHCIQDSVAKTCSSEETRCAKFTAELQMGEKKIMIYRKGCRAVDACKKKNDLFMQACGDDDTCEDLCCEKNLCNTGSFSTVNIMSVLACTLLALVYM